MSAIAKHPGQRVKSGAAASSDLASLLARLCIPQVPRALALMDREPTSPTYGSMDRSYWYYRTLTNFPGAVWQQPMVAFAALAQTRHDSNPYADAPELIEAARAALFGWSAAQHRGGAFDEWYRNEFSYCPTAITTAGAVVALDLLDDRIGGQGRDVALNAARQAGEWLAPRFNDEVMNQNLAALVAFAGLARLDGRPVWRERADRLLDRIAAQQSRDGWLPEYGGFDFGYSTLALDFLALAGGFGLEQQVDRVATPLVNFLLEVTEPHRAMPGRLGSRGTSHVFPFGAIALAGRLPAAKELAARLVALHADKLAAGPADVDDRYFSYFYLPAFGLAYRAVCLSDTSLPETGNAGSEAVDYPDSGLAIRRDPDISVVMNRRVGGAVALLRPGAPPLYHLGYTVRIGNRRYSSATWRNEDAPARANGSFRSSAPFSKVSGGLPLRWLTIPFQIAVHLLMSSRLAEFFQAAVKRAMINPKHAIPITLERNVVFGGGEIVLEDLLSPASALQVEDVTVTQEVAMHSPSARQDMGASCRLDEDLRDTIASALRSGRPISLRWTLPVADGEAHVAITK